MTQVLIALAGAAAACAMAAAWWRVADAHALADLERARVALASAEARAATAEAISIEQGKRLVILGADNTAYIRQLEEELVKLAGPQAIPVLRDSLTKSLKSV